MYYLLLAIFYPLSLLPLPMLYALSDAAFGVLYYLIGYRKKIVLSNLQQAFPEKNSAEIKQIEKAFYRNFCDQWVETIKLLTISEKELNRRMEGNWEVFQQLNAEGKNCYALLGHFFNWEWANLLCGWKSEQVFGGIYLPVSSNGFDRLMYRIRARSGNVLISMKNQQEDFKKIAGRTHIVGLIADQNPSVISSAAWLTFMHREAPFFRGPEMLSRRANAAVVFAGIEKRKRGYYKIRLQLFCENAAHTNSGEIIRGYVHFLEESLRKQPANWLWSHRRWKHVRETKV